jgi:hypothetical protein
MTPEEVTEALSVRCEMCGADCGQECLSIIDGRPLRETGQRPCHYYRKAS